MQSFLSDRHRNHSSLKCFIWIIWQRHWERIGKILSSNCKHVLKVRGEYQRICLHEVFIQLYKTGAGWICQLSIKEDLDFGRSFHSTRQVARLYNYCQLERTSNLAKFQLKLPRKYWICVLGEKFKIHKSWFPKLCLRFFFVNGFTLVKNGLVEEWTCLLLPTETVKKIVNLFMKKLRRVDFQSCDIRSFCEGVLCWSVMGDSYLIQTAFTCL